MEPSPPAGDSDTPMVDAENGADQAHVAQSEVSGDVSSGIPMDVVETNLSHDVAEGGPAVDSSVANGARLDDDLGPIFGMLSEVDDSVVMDASVAKVIMGLVAEGIVEETVDRACLYAKLREAKSVRVSDLQSHTERNLGIRIPGMETCRLLAALRLMLLRRGRTIDGGQIVPTQSMKTTEPCFCFIVI